MDIYLIIILIRKYRQSLISILTSILHRIIDIQGFPETIEGRLTINKIEVTTMEAQTCN
jgi:hypothetical protein